MKVFFTASQRGKKYFNKYYIQIHSLIGKLGFIHLDNTLKNSLTTEPYSKLEKEGAKAYVSFYEEKINYIKKADINIFECSMPSLSIGFQIEKSLEFNKPTVVFYLKDNPSYFLKGANSEKLIIKEYTAKSLEKIVKETLQEARVVTDKRFNFFISPKLLNYLNRIADELKITKSTHIRNLILEDMKKRKEQESLS